MIIAVTGANGHVGMNLCKALPEHGFQVRALVHKHAESISTLPITLVTGDILNYQSLVYFLGGVDVVIHLAGKISITGDPDGMVARINNEGTRNMLAAAVECRVKRFIHFSSIHAFMQHPVNEPLDEFRPLVDADGFAYDRSKAEGERAVMQAVKNGLDALVISPTAIIGPADLQPSLTGKALIDLCHGKIPALVPGGYDWVDIRDVVDATISAISNGRSGEKYILSGKWHSLKELSELIQLHTGRKIVSRVLPMWLARVGLPFITLYSRFSGTEPLYTRESLTIIAEGNRRISNDKARRELNFQPRPLTETIKDFTHWLKDHNFIR